MSPALPRRALKIRPAEGAAILCLLVLAASLASSFWGHASDDAYITYCYTRNWMETGEFRFQPGDAVSYGITAPGYAMLLGTLATVSAPLGLDIPGLGSLLSVVSLLYLTAMLWRFTRRSTSLALRALPLIAGTVLLTMPLMIGMWGSENMVAVSLMTTAAVLLFEKDRPGLAGLTAFLAIAMRLDAGLGALIIGLVALVRARKIPWAFGLAGLLPLCLWLPFLQSQFGSVIPTTLEAKRLLVTPGYPGYPGYTTQQWNLLRWAVSETACWNLLLLAALGLGAALTRAARNIPLVVSLGLWALGQEILYRQLGVPCSPWYHLVSLAALLVLAAVGAATLGLAVERRLRAGVLRKALTVLVMVLSLGPFWSSAHTRLGDKWQLPLDERFRIYRQLGDYLQLHAAPGDVVATVEIGIIAWFADRPILDLCGLISPAVIEATRARRLAEYVRAQRPTYIVDNPRFYGSASYKRVLSSSRLKLRYDLVHEFRTPEYRKGPIRLWKALD